jgi:hypothetical protein
VGYGTKHQGVATTLGTLGVAGPPLGGQPPLFLSFFFFLLKIYFIDFFFLKIKDLSDDVATYVKYQIFIRPHISSLSQLTVN